MKIPNTALEVVSINEKIVGVLKRIGAKLLPDSKTHRTRIEIRSESSNRLYVVSRRNDSKEWECSCPGWTRHSPRRPCKHLRTMAPVLDQIAEIGDGKKA